MIFVNLTNFHLLLSYEYSIQIFGYTYVVQMLLISPSIYYRNEFYVTAPVYMYSYSIQVYLKNLHVIYHHVIRVRMSKATGFFFTVL